VLTQAVCPARSLQVLQKMDDHPGMPQGRAAITYDDFAEVDIRVGRILHAEEFPEARKPAYKLTIDFGPEIGTKKSSAQLTTRYALEDLPGRLVLGVVNFPPRQIGPFISEVLTLGVPDNDGAVVLISPERDVPIGGRMF
jgi:tRNA-binding protein